MPIKGKGIGYGTYRVSPAPGPGKQREAKGHDDCLDTDTHSHHALMWIAVSMRLRLALVWFSQSLQLLSTTRSGCLSLVRIHDNRRFINWIGNRAKLRGFNQSLQFSATSACHDRNPVTRDVCSDTVCFNRDIDCGISCQLASLSIRHWALLRLLIFL